MFLEVEVQEAYVMFFFSHLNMLFSVTCTYIYLNYLTAQVRFKQIQVLNLVLQSSQMYRLSIGKKH